MRCSTSLGDMPLALMMTCTCGAEISGKASIGNVLNDQKPAAATPKVTRRIITRWMSEKRNSAAIMLFTPHVQADRLGSGILYLCVGYQLTGEQFYFGKFHPRLKEQIEIGQL